MTVAEQIENVKKLRPAATARIEFREGRIQMRLVVDASVAIKWP